MVRIVGFLCCGQGTILAQGPKILQAAWHGQKRKKGQRGRVAKEPAKLKGQMEEKTQKAEGNPFQSLPSLMPLINRHLTRAPGEESETASEEMEASRMEDQTGILEQMNKMWKSKGKKKTPLQAEILTRRNGRK